MATTKVNTDFEKVNEVTYEMAKSSEYKQIWIDQAHKLNDILQATNTDADLVNVGIKGFGNGLCPFMGWVTFAYVKPEDYPHRIFENSMYIQFKIEFDSNTVVVSDCGHCFLSTRDKSRDKYKYYAMRGAIEIAYSDYNVKKFRKYHFKDLESLAKKMQDYSKDVMTAVKDYTTGYPYHHGK